MALICISHNRSSNDIVTSSGDSRVTTMMPEIVTTSSPRIHKRSSPNRSRKQKPVKEMSDNVRRSSDSQSRVPSPESLDIEDQDSIEQFYEEEPKKEREKKRDLWSKTMTTVRVLRVFRESGKTRDEQSARKQHRRTLWRRLGFKLRILNVFTSKMKNKEELDPKAEAICRLKRKLGDVTVTSETEAHKYQQKIEETLQTTLEINLKPGDMILSNFENCPSRKKRRIFKRTLSFDDSNPRAVHSRGGGGSRHRHKERSKQFKIDQAIVDDFEQRFDRASRRLSWHSQDFSNYNVQITQKKYRLLRSVAPIVIISTPVKDEPPTTLNLKQDLPTKSSKVSKLVHNDLEGSHSSPNSSQSSPVTPTGSGIGTTQSAPVSPTSPVLPYRHYMYEVKPEGPDGQRRPSIVSRNIKKIFGKS